MVVERFGWSRETHVRERGNVCANETRKRRKFIDRSRVSARPKREQARHQKRTLMRKREEEREERIRQREWAAIALCNGAPRITRRRRGPPHHRCATKHAHIPQRTLLFLCALYAHTLAKCGTKTASTFDENDAAKLAFADAARGDPRTRAIYTRNIREGRMHWLSIRPNRDDYVCTCVCINLHVHHELEISWNRIHRLFRIQKKFTKINTFF